MNINIFICEGIYKTLHSLFSMDIWRLAFRAMCCWSFVMATTITKAQHVLQKDYLEISNSDIVNEVNLLENGGLEEWSNVFWSPYDFIEGWFCHNNDNVKKESKIVIEGKSSAKMQSQKTSSTARIDQRIAVSPGHKIRIRFSYYVGQWKSKGARTYCYFRTEAAEKYNISADELKTFYGNEQYYIIRGGGYGKTYFSHDLNVWQTFDETVEVPPTAHYFIFGINSYNGTTIYIDDCWVTDITLTTLKGDVNGDNVIDVADIASVISVMAGSSGNISATCADVNGDGVVDVADIATIISGMVN